MRARLALALALIVLAGCGGTPPQVPKAQGNELQTALAGISYACGEAYQLSAFDGDPRETARLNAAAASHANTVAHVYNQNPNWIYQGEKLHTIVRDSVSLLQSCGLHGAARTLVAATA